MLIDWFTVGAQVVNFLILLVLLKIFLFDRITHAMDEREKKISSHLKDAERKLQEARENAESVADEKAELDKKRDQLLTEAREDAQSSRKEWMDQARREVAQRRDQWEDALTEQKEKFSRDFQRMAAEQVYVVARRALRDLADEDLEERIIAAFLNRIAEMDRSDKKEFSRSLKNGNGSAMVCSSFEISTGMRQKITRTLRQDILKSLEIDYQTEPELLAGIQLKAAGKKLGWSVNDYLRPLEAKVLEKLQGQVHNQSGENQRQKIQPDDTQKGSDENG